jgi:hypothetical protein
MKYILLSILFFANSICMYCQEINNTGEANFYESTSGYNYRLKLSAYAFIKGGWGISLGFSNWITYKRFQPNQNFSINAVCGKNNLGNRNKAYNKWQLNAISSSILTISLQNRLMANYDEINPFYFGNSSAAFSNYKHSISLGSSFVAMPKGKGRNVMTPRNRSQQLIYLQIKSGDFQLNIYEDFLIITDYALFQMLADNRDRYFTGGGNVQLRLNKNYTLKYYTEMYTGNSYMDRDDYPDLVLPNDTMKSKFFTKPLGAIGPKRVKKYAYQDPGQKEFNHGRNFIALQVNSKVFNNDNFITNPSYTNDNWQVMVALQKGEAEMWQQNLIHSLNGIDRDLPTEPNKKPKKDRLHFFEPHNPPKKLIDRIRFGIAVTSDMVFDKIKPLKP